MWNLWCSSLVALPVVRGIKDWMKQRPLNMDASSGLPLGDRHLAGTGLGINQVASAECWSLLPLVGCQVSIFRLNGPLLSRSN